MPDLEMDDLERRLRDALVVTPDPAARTRSKARIMEATIPSHAPRRPMRKRGLVAPLAAAFIALSATGAAAVPASAHALPGDPLYGVRMATESIRISLASGPSDEAAVRLSVARARTVDLERAVTKGRDTAIEEISRRFFEQVRAVRALASSSDAAAFEARIAAQQAHLDEIADRIEDQIGEKARADEVLRDIRRHDKRPNRESSGKGKDKDDQDDDASSEAPDSDDETSKKSGSDTGTSSGRGDADVEDADDEDRSGSGRDDSSDSDPEKEED